MKNSFLQPSILVFLSVVILAGLGLAVHLGCPDLLTCPGDSSETKPVATAGSEKSFPVSLDEACRRREDSLRKRLDASFTVVTKAPFVIAGNMSPVRLEAYALNSVLRPAGAMWASYFRKKPTDVITVLLLDDDKSYRTWAKRLFDDGDLPHFGYYRPGNRTMVMNISTGTGTLVHELTHALIDYDFPQVPTWFNEGLASLHEQCSVGEKVITGLTNWRLGGLHEAIAKNKLRPLRDLVTRRDFYGHLQGQNYAQARYFVMYMQQRGVLAKFYEHFRSHHHGKDADVKAIEHVFGRKIEAVEKSCIAWVKTLRYP